MSIFVVIKVTKCCTIMLTGNNTLLIIMSMRQRNVALKGGATLRELMIKHREHLGFTQDDVVEQLKRKFGIDISRQYYGMIEQGKRTPGLKLAMSIAQLFNSSVRDIFYDL